MTSGDSWVKEVAFFHKAETNSIFLFPDPASSITSQGVPIVKEEQMDYCSCETNLGGIEIS
jgi:hypothetical protein